MGSSPNWFTVRIPELFSAWLWRTFRRPRRFLFLVVMLPMVAVVVATHQLNVALTRRQALHNLAVTARLGAQIVQETLDATLRAQRILLAQPGFSSAVQRSDRQQLTQLLRNALPYIPRVDLVIVLNAQGDVVASYPEDQAPPGKHLGDRDPFLGGRNQLEPYVSAVYLRDGPQVEKVVGVVYPVVHGGAVVGLLQFQHRVEDVKSWLQSIRVDPDGFLYVVDHHQQLVVHPMQVLPGEPLLVSHWPPVAAPLPSDSAALRYRDAATRRVWLSGLAPVGFTGWRVVAVQPEASALQSVRRVFWTLSLLVVLLLAGLVGISLRWAQLHAFCLRLLRQNTKLLKQLQQLRTLERGGPSDAPTGRGGP